MQKNTTSVTPSHLTMSQPQKSPSKEFPKKPQGLPSPTWSFNYCASISVRSPGFSTIKKKTLFWLCNPIRSTPVLVKVQSHTSYVCFCFLVRVKTQAHLHLISFLLIISNRYYLPLSVIVNHILVLTIFHAAHETQFRFSIIKTIHQEPSKLTVL